VPSPVQVINILPRCFIFSATVVSQLLSQKVLKAKTAFPCLENCFQNVMKAASGKPFQSSGIYEMKSRCRVRLSANFKLKTGRHAKEIPPCLV